MSNTTLDMLGPGARGRITGFVVDDAFSQRLMQLGLIEDTEVRMLRRAPTGDPLEVEVMGYALSLRRAEAATVRVLLLG